MSDLPLQPAPPPGELDAAKGVRIVIDAKGRRHERPVASTLQEAREKGWDFWHPRLGWIRRGFKREQEYTYEEEPSAP